MGRKTGILLWRGVRVGDYKLSSSLKESVISDAVKAFFKGERYFVPESEFNIGVRPDVVAFRWKDAYEVEAIAVECKATRHSRPLIEAALTQAREYQLTFPYVYVAAPVVDPDHLGNLKTLLPALRIGLLQVDLGENATGRVSREITPAVSPRLVWDSYLFKVRQRAAAILAYREATGLEDFRIDVRDPEIVWCFTTEAANLLLGNGDYSEKDYCFGISLEQQSNVETALARTDPIRLYQLIHALPQGYLVNLAYVDVRRPREVSWPLLVKDANKLTENDVKGIVESCERRRWKMRLKLHRRVWRRDEVLDKNDHVRRLKEAESELVALRQALRGESP